jgi:hypothetical protein
VPYPIRNHPSGVYPVRSLPAGDIGIRIIIPERGPEFPALCSRVRLERASKQDKEIVVVK